MSGNHWRRLELRKVLRLDYGASLPAAIRSGDGFPVFGSNGEVGRHQKPLVQRPGIIVGRKGTVGAVVWSSEPFWPIDTTYYVEPVSEMVERWCFWLLSMLPLDRLDSSTGVPGLNRNDVYALEISLPSLPEQRRIAEVLDTAEETIRLTEALIAKLKQMKQGLLHDLLTRGLDENGELRDPVAHPEQFKDSPLGRIPRGWDVNRLEQLAEIGSGVTLGRANVGMGTVELPYLRVANVQDGYLDLTDVKTVVVRRDEVERFSLEPGDVLMNEGGDFDKLGRGTVWEGQISPCLHQNHVFRVRTFRDSLDPYFLAAFSGSVAGKRYFVLSSKQSTNLASINSTQLKAFPIVTPPLSEQARITLAIRAHDTRIRAEEAYRDKLQLLKKGLMQDLLTGRVRVPVREKEPELLEVGA
jgi:type I restriction enzyme, S subunit